MTDLELLSIGDTTYDTFLRPTESESFCTLSEKESFICFTYGDKIPIKEFQVSLGGNAANNAVGTRRLGIKSALVTTLGDDGVGRQTLEILEKEEVDLNYAKIQKNSPSNFSTIINYAGERTIFTYRPERIYEFPQALPTTPWVYLTSVAENFQDFYSQVVNWLKHAPSSKLAFNPGSRQIRAGLEALRSVLEVTFIIYVNREEAETLTGLKESKGKEKELLTSLTKLGPKNSIITDGSGGSYVFDGQKYIHAGVMPVDAYERTGAGDAFGSGCLSALIKGKKFDEALLWGTLNSASVIGYIGSQKGLLKESELPVWLDRAKSCKVEVSEF
jgi:sugar/nucleoside kinase (ribokinase family)